MRNLIVSVEAYPDLKSNQNFLELQRQLAETEDRIAAGRRFYNANVRVYNTKVESVPTNIIANMFKFEKATYFEVNDPTVRQAPDVSFGEIAYRGDPQQGQLPPQQSRAAGAVRPAQRRPARTRSSTSSPSTSRRTSRSARAVPAAAAGRLPAAAVPAAAAAAATRRPTLAASSRLSRGGYTAARRR